MNNHPTTNNQPQNPWPHRLAWLVACGVFPLIWMGGLVTTYGAGMAVPDWPTTYESWFYPLQKWIWKTSSDLFLEHGHRTLAQLVGVAAIFLLIAVFRNDRRKSVRWLAIFILSGLLFQGTLGGFRVLLDERLLARIHGCTAPVVFCLCALMVTLTSKNWQLSPLPTNFWSVSGESPGVRTCGRPLLWLTPLLAGLVYLEIVFGTLLRHPLIDAWTNWSLVWAWSKVITVGVLLLCLIYLIILVPALRRGDAIPRRSGVAETPTDALPSHNKSFSILCRRIILFASLFFLQVALACTTWVANYGWPKWFTDNFFTWNYTVVKGGLLQVWFTTAHAAVGSLVLVAEVNLLVWSWRLLRGPHE